MKIRTGNLIITKQNVDQRLIDEVEEIWGDLRIQQGKVALKKLRKVKGSIHLHEETELIANKLGFVDESLRLGGDTILTANNLEQINSRFLVGPNVTICANKLTTVLGSLHIDSKLGVDLEKQLWSNNDSNLWFLTDNCSEYLLSRKGDIFYHINGVKYNQQVFEKIRKGEYTFI